MRGAILHPLASMTIEPQEWLNQLQLGRLSSLSTIEAGSFQSAYLNESVYISDNTPASYCSNKSALHVCRVKKQSYCKLAAPTEGYALAVYQSKIVLIGGDKPSPYQGRSNDDPKYRMISVLDDDCGLEEKLKSALDSVQPKFRYIYEIGRNACAVGEGDLLIVIGGDGPHKSAGDHQLKSNSHDYVRVFNGKKWSRGLIDVTTAGYGNILWRQQKTLVVFQDHLYMSAFDNNSLKIKF